MHVPQTEVILKHADVELARVTVPPGDYVIGRSAEVEIHAETPLLSRKHAKLTIEYDQLFIQDLRSSNGTFINDQPVKEITRVFPNQCVRLGPDITLEIHRQRTPSEPDLSLAPKQAAIRRYLPEELLTDKRYAIGGQIAQGGMGAILDAKQTATQRTVAMKVMLGSADEGDVLRFIEEAQVTAQLEHPNIVPVHELGVDEQDQVFYTMKMVRGITLKKVLDLLAEGMPETVKKYPLPTLLTIFQKVCDAIAFAHSRGVIHRDLKPENIMLDDFGVVLVMDWGIAKVIKDGAPNSSFAMTMREGVASVRSGQPELSGTLAGTIMGTPQYMSPEQARGEIDSLDVRSDIYTLGAILYRILTLHSHVTGQTAGEIVDKTGRGEIEPLNSPKLGKVNHLPGGAIPDSLSAVVRKAMALDKSARYQRAEDLQRDLNAYQTGFATGAENAGAWKQITLLVKRHKGVAISVALALLIIVTLSTAFTMRVFHEKHIAEHNAEVATQNEKRANSTLDRLRGTAPTFQAQAQALIEKQQFSDALEKINYAIDLNPTEAEYHDLKGNILEDLSRLADAQQEYTQALQHNPAHAQARENLDLCNELLRVEGDHGELSKASVNKLNLLMREEGRAAEAIATVRVLSKDRQALYDTWKAVFAKAGWPRDANTLILDNDGLFQVNLHEFKLDDISFLHRMPVKSLILDGAKVSNLQPLEGAPLRVLDLNNVSTITDLSPLRGMKLTDLNLHETKVTDLSPLQGMPLEHLNLWNANGVSDISALRGMPLKVLVLRASNVTDIRALQGMPLVSLNLQDNRITDYSPLKGMRLAWFEAPEGFRDSDLALLREMPIEHLALRQSSVSDLRPLQAMPLKELNLDASNRTRITDLSPLAEMKLTSIDVANSPIADLSALRGQPVELAVISRTLATDFSVVATWPLNFFYAEDTKFSDLRLLAGKTIKGLDVEDTPVADISPLRGMPIRTLLLWGTKVTDLRPLAELPDLEELSIPSDATDIEFLRHLPNLRSLDNHHVLVFGQRRPVAEFWKEYDAKQAAGKK